MAFPRKLLNEGEDVVLDLRPHWSTLTGPVAAVVIVLAGAVAALVLGAPAWTAYPILGLVALAALWLAVRWLRWTTTNFTVTNDRIVYRSGVLAKKGREIPLDRVNDISFNQGVFERIIGAGDLMIESAGQHGQERYTDIPRPSKVQNVIYREMERFRGREADRASGHHELSVPEQLEKLDELRQRGVISQEEFDQKKAQLLERM
ncbi:MAG TPA: PH domain-containing protein [Acidimicrobiales bacterium]